MTTEREAVYAAMPEPAYPTSTTGGAFDHRQMRAFADATHELRVDQAQRFGDSEHLPGADILADLKRAAAAKWQGNPAAQRAGLFARAAAEIERLRMQAPELSDKEILAVFRDNGGNYGSDLAFARAVIAAHEAKR